MFSRILLIVALCFFGAQFQTVDAASLYMDPSSATVKRGNSATVSVRLDTDEDAGECVNVISSVITYESEIDPIDISIGDSILNVWVEDPIIDKVNKQIRFAGGITNGYCGRVPGDPRLTNNIIDIVFLSPGFQIGEKKDSEDTKVDVSFTSATEVYLNDGRGTKASLSTYGTTLTLSDELGRGDNDEWLMRVADDERPPEEFTISLVRDENGGVFGGRWYIVFNTDDKQTGLDHYEVIEETFAERNLFSWGAADAPWLVARSPYKLSDQSLNSTIRVKAIDKAGNSYIATLVPDAELRTLSMDKYIVMALGGVGLLVIVGAAFFVYLYWRRSRQESEAEETVSLYEDN